MKVVMSTSDVRAQHPTIMERLTARAARKGKLLAEAYEFESQQHSLASAWVLDEAIRQAHQSLRLYYAVGRIYWASWRAS